MPSKHTPVPPIPDVAGARAPFADLPTPIQPRVSENDRAYSAFLLWCMMAPGRRSKRGLATCMGVSDGNVRFWHKRYGWDKRLVQVSDAEWQALRAYRQLMDLAAGAMDSSAMKVAMDVLLDRRGLSAVRHAVKAQRQGAKVPKTDAKVEPEKRVKPRSDRSPNEKNKDAEDAVAFAPPAVPVPANAEFADGVFDASKHMLELRENVLKKHLTEVDIRRQILLIDGVFGLIFAKIKDKSLDVKVSDIPQLIRARAVLTGLPAPVEPMTVQHQHQHNVVVATESARMRDARQEGSEAALLAAMQKDLDEVSTILNAMPRPVEARVVDVPSDDETSDV